MPNFPFLPSLCPQLKNLALDRQLVTVHNRATSALLWYSPEWGVKGADILGDRWQEFVFPADLSGFLAWLRDGEETEHSLRVLLIATGEYVRVHYFKFSAECRLFADECTSATLCKGRDAVVCVVALKEKISSESVLQPDQACGKPPEFSP